jgi:hypothetical protein
METLPAPPAPEGTPRRPGLSHRERVRNFVHLGYCGTVQNPVRWGLLLRRAQTCFVRVHGPAIAPTLLEDFPELYAAIVKKHGMYQPDRSGPPAAA